MGKQEEVDMFMNRYSLNIKPEYRALNLSAEVGELFEEMLSITGYGERSIEKNDSLKRAFGDVYFALIALANNLGVDLDLALDSAMEQYEKEIED